MADKVFKWQELDPVLQTKLKQLENVLGSKLTYTSGLRTQAYNNTLPLSSKNSMHIDWDKDGDSEAVDFLRSTYKETPEELIPILVGLGFTGIGIYDKHIHVDVRKNPHERGYSFWDERTKKGQWDYQYDFMGNLFKSDDYHVLENIGSVLITGTMAAMLIKLISRKKK